jgi:site-specific DNA recombinase
MSTEQEKIKYFVYTRKSTEDQEKQALSIESQKDKALEIFPDLDVVEVFSEEKSAFTPKIRPVFSSMIERIRRGEAQGIIAWHPDRLARNEIDGSEITYMIRGQLILDLKFCNYHFDNSPEGIMFLQLAFSQSQYSSAKLSKDVKRGLEKKIKMGWLPGVAPSGYLNNKYLEKGSKEIIIDKERFPLVRKAWDLMLTGSYTPPKVVDVLNNQWGYRTLKRRRGGGFPMSRSAIYKIFTNPFYAGIIGYDGKQYEGKHKKMVSLEEYDRVQSLLGSEGRPRPKKHAFAFTGMMRCGSCGCFFTAEKKLKYIKSTGKTNSYVYYHCSHSKQNTICAERACIPEAGLELQVEELIEQYEIIPEFRDWALEALRGAHKVETETREKIYDSLHKELISIQKKEDNLIEMRCNDLLTDEEYKTKKSQLQNEKSRLKELLRDSEARADKWIELTEKAFDFATYARQAFISGDLQIKKEILSALGSNHMIKGGKLFISANKYLQPISKNYPQLEKEYLALEPRKKVLNKAKTESLNSVRTRWLRGWDSNPRPRD